MSCGHDVLRVNFCGGDWLYGRRERTLNYRGESSGLTQWYTDVMLREGISDVIMFGDCRDIHRQMHPVAQKFGVRVHVFEEGYVRPNWITLEHHGVNGRSLLPKHPDWYRERRNSIVPAQAGQPTGYNLYARAFHDITYRAANALLACGFPRYGSHRPRNGFVEYVGLASRALMQGKYVREAEAVTNELLESAQPYYLFPLQLNSDAQITVHSPFEGVEHVIRVVVDSFARCAPANAWLVVKNHPLDTGLIKYRQCALEYAKAVGVERRIRFIDAGHLPTLLNNARGVVVVNSTVGLSALHHQRPLIALGTAIYGMDGLTWQGALDDFWLNGREPDMGLYHTFLSYVTHRTQINGDFYTRTGIEMVTRGALARLTSDLPESVSAN